MEIDVEDYGTVEACFGLQRVNLELGEGEPPSSDLPPPDDIPVNLPSGGVEPTTDLLVIGSRAVAPYYREAGTVEPIGPYVFTAKVWVR
jgi:hypothetical protein